MGACCSGEESKKIVEEESMEIEQKAADAIEATKEIAEAAQKKAAEVTVAVQDEVAAIAEAAKEIAEGAAQKVAHIDQAAQKEGAEVAEAAEAKVAAIVLAAEKGAEVAKAAEANVAPIAEAAQEEVAEVAVVAVVAAAKEGTEAACATMDAAAAAVTGVMIVEFVAEKGAFKKVDFKTKNVGFEIAMAGGGCCGPAGQAQVAVNKVDKKGQAETLGVKRGWRVKSINGREVTSLKPSQKLLEESIAKLPKA
mmetsp:Transcript_62653/g.164337  ORF Transcript_62653/g.164337 Transcript_62653/m.164337 type:complete len:252 (-) Transcript_62653:337-1092(-)